MPSRATTPRGRRSGRRCRASRGRAAAGRSPRASCAAPGASSPPTTHSTVPTSPAAARPPPGSSAAGTSSSSSRSCPSPRHVQGLVGSPKNASAATAIAARASSTSSCGNVELERALHDQRDGARSDRASSEVVPVGTRSGHAEEQRARDDAAGVVRELADLDSAAGTGLARREHALRSSRFTGGHSRAARRASRFSRRRG